MAAESKITKRTPSNIRPFQNSMKTQSEPQSVNAPSVCYHFAFRMKLKQIRLWFTARQQTMQTSARAHENKQTIANGRERKQTTTTDKKTKVKAPALMKTRTNVNELFYNKKNVNIPEQIMVNGNWRWKPTLPSGRRWNTRRTSIPKVNENAITTAICESAICLLPLGSSQKIPHK